MTYNPPQLIARATAVMLCCVCIIAAAQNSGDNTRRLRSDADSELRLTVNPFTSEALLIQEIELRKRRLQLEREVGAAPIPTDSSSDGIIKDQLEIILQIQSDLEDIDLRLNNLENNPVGEDDFFVDDGDNDFVNNAEPPAPEYPHKNAEAVFYGTIDFGRGSKAVYYDANNENRMRTVAVGGFAPKPVVNEDQIKHAEVNRIDDERIIIGWRGVPFVRDALPIIENPPADPTQ